MRGAADGAHARLLPSLGWDWVVETMQKEESPMATSITNRSVTRRATLAGLGAGGLGVALAVSTRPAAAQDAASTMASHPIVGTWVSKFADMNPGTSYSYFVYHADGTFIELHPFAGTLVGAWQPTGERTANTIIKGQNIGLEWGGFVPGMVTAWISVTVDESGDAFTGDGVLELAQPDGTVVALVPLTGSQFTRLVFEPPPPLATPKAATPTG
jgi:hypothetical protein